jgi:hypothetical protein
LDLFRALKILEIRSYSEPEDLKRSFRLLAHRYHPDKNLSPEAGDLFRDVLEAYQYCLDNLEILALHFGLKPAPELLNKDKLVIENLDDIFEDIFGFSRAGRVLGFRQPQALRLTLTEFLFGGTKIEKLPAYESCRDCRGVGAAKGTLSRLCRHCFGKGYYLKKMKRQGVAEEFVDDILNDFEVVPLSKDILRQARTIKKLDYEDLIQYFSAIHSGCDSIITRNKKDFPVIGIKLFSPDEFLKF